MMTTGEQENLDNRKKVLVYLYYYFPYENANTNVMLPIIDALKERFDVYIYTIDDDRRAPSYEEKNGLRVRRDHSNKRRFRYFVHAVYDSEPAKVTGRCKPIKRLILRIFHRTISKERLERILPNNAQLRYERALREGRYDALITVTAPIVTQYETLPSMRDGWLRKLGTKWYPYFTDPHATFVGHKDKYDGLMARELEVYQLADGVFTSLELYEDNKNTPLGAYTAKTYPVQFANLRQVVSSQEIPYLEKGKTNCVYVGSLFSIAVRDPEYFFKVARACGHDFRFHIVCYTADEENLALKARYVDGSPNIVWHQRAPLAECHSLMTQADILINLGNRTTNQTPSKIFDYIGAGKPIVNFCALKNDTARHYLERYPLKLNIEEKPQLDTEDIRAFETFCRENAGKQLDYEETKTLYPDCIAETVARGFADKLQELLEDRGQGDDEL